MQKSGIASADLVMSIRIELERMFTVISHRYNKERFPEDALMLPKIDEALANALKLIDQEHSEEA